jgi:large subunit ribosomal protein L4
MYEGAICCIYSELIRQDRMRIVSDFQVDSPKTKAFLKKLHDMKLEQPVVLITDSIDENLYLAARNLPHTQVLDIVAASSDPVTLVKAENVIMTEAAIKKIEELLK